MQMMESQRFYVGDWLVEPALHRLTYAGKTVQIEPKMMRVLVCLAEHAGEVVTRDTLMEQAWDGTVVTDDVVSRAVSKLRRLMQEGTSEVPIIATIRKSGYRLLAPVSPASSMSSPGPEQGRDKPWKTAEAISRKRWARWGVLGATLLVVGAGLFVFKHIGREPQPVLLHPVPVTALPGNEYHPALSPDGQRIAFVWDGGAQKEGDIYVGLVGTTSLLQLTDTPADEAHPAWSADGVYVYFRRRSAQACTMYKIPFLGGQEQGVGSCNAQTFSPLAHSPDGRWLAFPDYDSTRSVRRIFLRSSATVEKHALTLPPSTARGDLDPVFSPDGQTVAFKRIRSEGLHDLFMIPSTGGTTTRLTFDHRNVDGHTWTPDGQSIVFSSNRSGYFHLWRVQVAGGTLEPLPLADRHTIDPHMARRQERLVYTKLLQETNIWRIQSETASGAEQVAERLVASTRWDLHPQFSPQGNKIAFTSNRSGSYEIWTCAPDGTNLNRLTAFEGPFVGTPRWSPDGTYLVFDARPEGHADLFIIDAEGGLPQRLTQDPSDELAASWSPDGNGIYFSSNRAGRWHVWNISITGDEAIQMTRDEGFGPQVAPDGRFLYYTKPGAAGLWRRPIDEDTEQQILKTLAASDWGNWTLTKDGVYYVERSPTKIMFSRFDTGDTRPVFIPPRSIPRFDPSLTVSPDGRWILYGQIDRMESDIMMVEGGP